MVTLLSYCILVFPIAYNGGLVNYADSSLEHRCHLQDLEETNAVMGQVDSQDVEEVAEVVMTTAVEGTDPIRGRISRMKTCCSVFFPSFCLLNLDRRIHRYIL